MSAFGTRQGRRQTCDSLRVVLTSFPRRKSLPAQSRLRAGIDLAHQQASKWRSTFHARRDIGRNRIRSGFVRAAPERTWPIFWRVEGSLADLTAVRPVAFFTWNAHTFAERWARRGGLFLEALVRPALYASHRVLATRVLHALLRGVTRDRLDLLGEEYFHYVLKPQLKPEGVKRLNEWMAEHGQVVLVSQGLDHVMRPLAQHLGVEQLVANRLEFRDGVATGRLLDPVMRPRGPLALLLGRRPGRARQRRALLHDLGLEKQPELLSRAIFSAARPAPPNHQSLVLFDHRRQGAPLSVRQALRGKQILLIGVTGFIGKVWLEHLLSNVPEIGKIYLLVRRQRTHDGAAAL